MSLSLVQDKSIVTRLEALDEAFFELGPDLNILEANTAFAKTLGAVPENLRGKSYLSIFPHSIGTLSFREFKLRLKWGGKGAVEDFCIARRAWFEYRISPSSRGICVFAFNINKRKQNEQAKLNGDSRAHSMIENAGVALARLGLDGRWLEANARCVEITGYAMSELKDFRWSDFYPIDERRDFTAQLVDLISGRISNLEMEQRILCKDDLERWVQLNISLVRSPTGHPLFFTAIFSDITERKSSQSSLQFALRAAQMGEWDYDAMENTTRRSQRFNQIYGYDHGPAEWTFNDFVIRTRPEEREALKKTFRESIDTGTDLNLEIRILTPAHGERWVSLRAQVYLNQQGRTVRMAGLIKDITDPKRVALELQNAKLAAEDANREKSYFLANMSHEIRTPLGAILGFTDALRDVKLSEQDHTHYLDVVQRNGHALASLIDDILDLSKVESGHLDVENVRTDVPELVLEVCALLQVKADAKGLKLESTLMNNPPTCIATDRIRLRQILINIVGNAIKFTGQGQVKVEVRREAAPAGDLVVFRVSDTGPGITRAQSQRLFQPFMQADSSTTRQFGGTGLGLALSRRLARAMGGDLTLESSEPGQGATFRIHLPITSVEHASLEQPAAQVENQNRPIEGVHVLLAEDCIDNQELIKHLLDKVGTQTSTVEDGHAAVARALSEKFDLILMDMQMPELDGYEATRRLRQAGFTGPIIALTANAMRHDRDRCLNAGCTDYLSKPINPDSLYRLIGNSVPHAHHN